MEKKNTSKQQGTDNINIQGLNDSQVIINQIKLDPRTAKRDGRNKLQKSPLSEEEVSLVSSAPENLKSVIEGMVRINKGGTPSVSKAKFKKAESMRKKVESLRNGRDIWVSDFDDTIYPNFKGKVKSHEGYPFSQVYNILEIVHFYTRGGAHDGIRSVFKGQHRPDSIVTAPSGEWAFLPKNHKFKSKNSLLKEKCTYLYCEIPFWAICDVKDENAPRLILEYFNQKTPYAKVFFGDSRDYNNDYEVKEYYLENLRTIEYITSKFH